MSGSYVRYKDDVETIDPDEAETIAKIIETMAKGGRLARERYGRSVRTSHAKAHGLLTGELRVLDDLPQHLRQGLFAVPGTYEAAVRLAHVPGEFLDDRKVSTPRGMAIKIFGVDGPKLPAHEGQETQDFVLDTGKVFNAGTAKTFLTAISGVEAAMPLPEGVKGAVSNVSRVSNAALNLVGLNSANLDFFGHPFNHPLGEEYFSQIPFRYGDYIAKLGVFPDTPGLRALAEQTFKPRDEDGLRTAIVAFFRSNPAEFEVRIQLCTDLDKMPVENASKEWAEDESPYQPVARLVLPAQDAYAPARQDVFEEELSFCPAHSLAAHRPLGSIARARMHAYEVLGTARRRENGRTTAEPQHTPA